MISLIIPCRNEEGTVETAIELGIRLPGVSELIVVEGGSKDKTLQVAQECLERIKKGGVNTKILQQVGAGKWNAVKLGIHSSVNEAVSIWDADLTVAFTEQALIHEKFLAVRKHTPSYCLSTGNRLENRLPGAMRPLNLLGNKFFAFFWSIHSLYKIPDTLCGSKVFDKSILKALPKRLYELDPFGDFTIIASAIVHGARMEFQPLAYRPRTYGQTNISRWKDGIKLLRLYILHSKFLRQSKDHRAMD